MKKYTCLILWPFLLANGVGPKALRPGKDYAVFFYVTQFQPGWQGLPDTQTEAQTLKVELESNYGFIGKLVPNPTRQQIFDEIAAWNARLGPDDQMLFFFSMHGYYDPGSELGYLVAADGKYNDPYYASWLDYNNLRPYFARCKAKHVLVALDACHSGAFGNIEKAPDHPAYEEGDDCEAQLQTSFRYKVRQYLCAGNKDAKTPGKSQLVAKFLEALRKGADADGLLHFDDLTYALGKLRNPEPVHGTFSGHEPGGDFVFVRKNGCGAKVETADRDGDGVPDTADACPDHWGSQANGCSPDPSNNEDVAADLEAWRTAKRTNTEAAYKGYLHRFPNGEFKEPANQALRKLETEAANRRDNTAWDIAEEKNTLEAYQKYRADYPKGLHSAAAADKIKALETPAEANDGLVLVRGGTFDMGCTSEQQDCGSDEKPAHRVSVNDFYIGRYEVTQKLWREVMGSDPAELNFKGCDECPVERVSWNDVQEFLQKLNARSPGRNYRLPTEAEWEYAARGGGKAVLFGNGKNTADPAEINFNGSASYKKPYSLTGQYRQKTVPVGSLNSPNALGLHDMSGNVREWCEDWYHDSYKGAPTDGSAWLSPAGSSRVFRGGSWYSFPQYCRVADRGSGTPGYRSDFVGFRLARTK